MSSIAGLIVATSFVLGQTDQPSAYEHLKGLEWLVGDMVGEFISQEGWDESVPVGTKVVRRSSTRWALNRSILLTELSETAEGQPPFKWLEIVGWDPSSKQIVHWILWPGGGSGSGVWSKVGDEWQLKWTAGFPTGAKYSGTGRMRVTVPDTFSWGTTDATKDGKKIADIPTAQFRKTDTAKASGLPDEYLKFLENNVGEWNIEGTAEGGQITGECEFAWAMQRHCVEYRGTWNASQGFFTYSGLSGWDPAKKQVVNTEYWSGGGYNVLRFAIASPSVWEGKMAGVDEEGRPTGGQIRVEMKGADEFVFTATKVFKGDQPQPDQKLVFRRR